MKKKVAFLIGFLLLGCHTAKNKNDKNIDSAASLDKEAQAISRTQEKWHQSGAIHQQRPHFSQAIVSDDHRVHVNWQGDALELLAQLSHQRGLTFSYSGIRLPLPVNLSVRFMRFDDLIQKIETQIRWRATLQRETQTLHLYFSLTEKAALK